MQLWHKFVSSQKIIVNQIVDFKLIIKIVKLSTFFIKAKFFWSHIENLIKAVIYFV